MTASCVQVKKDQLKSGVTERVEIIKEYAKETATVKVESIKERGLHIKEFAKEVELTAKEVKERVKANATLHASED